MNRVEHFRRARYLAFQDTERFRIRYWKMNGGFAWSLEQFTKANSHQNSLFLVNVNGTQLITMSGGRLRSGTEWGWEIIDHSDLWIPDHGSSVSSLSERRRSSRWNDRNFPP